MDGKIVSAVSPTVVDMILVIQKTIVTSGTLLSSVSLLSISAIAVCMGALPVKPCEETANS
jgi:hypothetical protein